MMLCWLKVFHQKMMVIILLLVFLQVVLLLPLLQTENHLKPFGLSRSSKLNVSENAELDDYGHSIAKGVPYMKGCFLDKVTHSPNGQIFKISRKVTLFYKENVLHLYVNFTVSKKGLIWATLNIPGGSGEISPRKIWKNIFCNFQICHNQFFYFFVLQCAQFLQNQF